MSQSAMQQALSALKALRDHFPTDVDMVEAGCNEREIAEACTAYKNAQTAIATLKKELTLHAAGPAGGDAIYEALLEYRCQHTLLEDDGSGIPLLDALTPPGDTSVQRGFEELRALADHIADNASLAIEANEAKEAVRYRWLRDDPRGRALSMSAIEWSGDPAKADAAIDAAMSTHQPKESGND